MSDFCTDSRGVVVDTFFRLTCSFALWEGGTLQTNHTGVRSQCLRPHWACPHSRRACPPCPDCSGSRLLHLEPSEAGPGLHAPPRSKPLRFRHSEMQTRFGLHFVPFPSLSSSGHEVFGKHDHCNLSPVPPLLLGFLGVQLAHLLRQMMTVQNPKKS